MPKRPRAVKEQLPEPPLIHGIPGFNPGIGHQDGYGMLYDDGRVDGAVDVVTDPVTQFKTLVIHEWNARYPGHGHSLEALQWLRPLFATIVANGVGTIDDGVGDIATHYWTEMYRRGLVDELVDDHGEKLSLPPRRTTPAP